MFEQAIYNESLGVGILEVLLNPISCHEFMKGKLQLWYWYVDIVWCITIQKKSLLLLNKTHGSITYCPTSIKEVINWFSFMTIMEYNANKIDNEKIILPSLLSMCSIF